MRMLLGLASVAVLMVPAVPAFAQAAGPTSVRIHRGGDHGGHHGNHRASGRDRRFGHFASASDERRFGRGFAGDYGYGGEWARYNNRSWDSDSYNDWWHDQPWRSYPRWLNNDKCERMWYSADTLRC
jgi:hypothetical protein